MISSRPLFRINVLAWRATNVCAKSQPPQYLQKCYFGYELTMDAKKGMLKDTGRGKGKTAKQTWRAVSTQSSSFECDGEKGEVQSRLKNIYHATSSTSLTAKCENINPEDVNEPVHLGTCVSLEDAKDDRSIDGKLMTLEKHSITMNVGQSLMGFIAGKGRGTQKEIEEMTGVKIILPSSREEESIIIEGNSVESVTKASEKVQIIIDKAVNSRALEYSHFVSLPLAIHPGLVDKLINFQNRILQTVACDNDLGIEKSIFIKPKTFHLTILMLKLWNKERVNAAAEVLQSVSSQVLDALDNRPVFIKLKGLECMKGSLAKARVLYAPVEEVGGEDRLLRASQVIIDAFAEAGLLVGTDVQHKLKLHATLMNERHRNRNKNTRKLDSFDARGIFDRYGSEEWGEYPIREAHLSQRFAFDENGYYHCCASIPFPDNMQVE